MGNVNLFLNSRGSISYIIPALTKVELYSNNESECIFHPSNIYISDLNNAKPNRNAPKLASDINSLYEKAKSPNGCIILIDDSPKHFYSEETEPSWINQKDSKIQAEAYGIHLPIGFQGPWG
jgi:hypothetical protein